VIVVVLTVPRSMEMLATAAPDVAAKCYAFGFLWGIGNLMWGLSIRYLGLSLGYALTLGYCAAFGTLVPPIVSGEWGPLIYTTSGLVTLGSVFLCLVGIAVCGWAGMAKERELSQESKTESIEEFDFKKGFWVALVCGVLSACFFYGLEAGKPLAEHARSFDTRPIFANNPVLFLVCAGGATSNFIWCIILNVKNRTAREYCRTRGVPLVSNYVLCAAAGLLMYLGFLFYGISETMMGKYSYASCSIFMALNIAFSNVWAIVFHEWKSASRRTMTIIVSGIAVLVVSAVLTGVGSYLGTLER